METTEKLETKLDSELKLLREELRKKYLASFGNIYAIPVEVLEKILIYITDTQDIINLRQANRLFKWLLDTNSALQEQLRQVVLAIVERRQSKLVTKLETIASSQPANTTPEESRTDEELLRIIILIKDFLNSPRAQEQIKQGTFNILEALYNIQRTLKATKPLNYSNFAADRGTVRKVIKLGYLPKQIRYKWFTATHLDALEKGIPLEEIQRLSKYQVEAMSIAKLTRKDVEGQPLTEAHIKALSKGKTFEWISKFSSIQLTGLEVGFSEKDVTEKWFSSKHIETIRDGLYEVSEIRGLYPDQLEGYLIGIDLKEILEINRHGTGYDFSDISTVCQLVNNGLTIQDLKTIPQSKLNSLHDLSNISINDFNEMKNSITRRGPKLYDFDYTVELGNRGYPESETKMLNHRQKQAIVNWGTSLEQVKDPRFSHLAAQVAFHCNLPYETLLTLPMHQLAALWEDYTYNDPGNALLTLEEVKSFTPLHTVLFKSGIPYKELLGKTGEELLPMLIQTPTVNSTITTPTPLLLSSQAQALTKEGKKEQTKEDVEQELLNKEQVQNTTKGFANPEELKEVFADFQAEYFREVDAIKQKQKNSMSNK